MAHWKKNIKRVFITAIWCAIAVGSVALLIAAMNRKSEQKCSGYEIEILGTEEQMFIDKKKVEEMVFGGQQFLNKNIAEYNLRAMERKLESDVWVKDAELYFDHKGMLTIKVTEREPIARVFNMAGNSFYIDSSGQKLPLPENQAAHLLVFTGFPLQKGKLKTSDSLLMRQMIDLSLFINKHPFWSAQIQQIDITTNKTFELVPLVGNHLVVFGNGDDIPQKFARLEIFYKEVMSKTGFDFYDKLDVQYKDQVVATKKSTALSKQDSILAVQKVKQMIAEAQQIEPDTLTQRNIRPIEKLDVSEQTLANYDLVPMNSDTALPETPKNPDPLKTLPEKSSNKNIISKPPMKQEKAKAVMKRGF